MIEKKTSNTTKKQVVLRIKFLKTFIKKKNILLV